MAAAARRAERCRRHANDPRITPLLDQPTRRGHREDRANRGAQQGDAELGIVQPQPVLNGRNARHPAAEYGTEEKKESRCRPAGLTQVIGVMCAVADGRFDSEMPAASARR